MNTGLSFATESAFGFDELFFSRTNSKGIIQSGNSVFQQVSKYEWDEILKKPHNIIRHPAMPKAVFHLLWEAILSGKPIGAYVVNLAKDGSYYWVFALVSPIADGFLSVRLKPSSPIFQIIKQKYAELLELEKSKKLTPKQSQEFLLVEIKKLNFRSYHHFMTESLTQELECRQVKLNLEPIGVISLLREVLKLGTQLQGKCEEIFSAYHKSAFVPLNMEVLAAKIGQDAAPIAVVSSQYDDVAKQIQAEIKKFMNAGNLVQEKVEECQFDVCNSLLQKEMFGFFKDKDKDKETPLDKTVEMALLEDLGKSGIEKAKASLTAIDIEFSQFKIVYEEVRQLATALDIISLTGKIEAVKVKQNSTELLQLLNDLMTFKTALKKTLKEIDDLGRDLITQTHDMREELA